ncbi:MAG: quinone oxidoreductase family protein [Nitriliruptorales bacterium]
MRAVRINERGDPDVLTVEDIPMPHPGPEEVRVRIEAAGLNFIDIYHRDGRYDLELPITPGVEGAGVVDAVGGRVEGFAPGDRVAWAMGPGAYAEYAVVPSRLLVGVADEVDLRLAAAVMLQGMTAHYLSHTTYPLKAGDTCLVTAAAGGVGHLLVQLAKERGARVIATVSTEEKEKLARQAGADEVVRYTEVLMVEAVRDLTDGRGVDVVYDSVGKDTFAQSLRCLRPRGFLVLYGQASGRVEPQDPQVLNDHGSLYLTRPSLAHHIAEREELEERAGYLFSAMAKGSLVVRVDRTFALEEAADAHRHMEGRQTKGKVLLVP